MRTTLFHNPEAGLESPSKDELKHALKAAGYKVDYQSIKKKKWEEALEDPGDLVVVAGGDGTIAKVISRLVDCRIPIALLPVGTANNIATSLGICGAADELIASWPHGQRLVLDVGIVSGPWGDARFVEGVGAGLFTQSMALSDVTEEVDEIVDRDDRLGRGLKLLQMTLANCRSREWEVTIDGEDVSGECFLFEILNIPCIGPNLCLARDGQPGDGRLDVVMLREEHRAQLDAYLARRLDGEAAPVDLPVHSARRVGFQWDGSPIHVDDRIHADIPDDRHDRRSRVEVWLEGTVEVLVSR